MLLQTLIKCIIKKLMEILKPNYYFNSFKNIKNFKKRKKRFNKWVHHQNQVRFHKVQIINLKKVLIIPKRVVANKKVLAKIVKMQIVVNIKNKI